MNKSKALTFLQTKKCDHIVPCEKCILSKRARLSFARKDDCTSFVHSILKNRLFEGKHLGDNLSWDEFRNYLNGKKHI